MSVGSDLIGTVFPNTQYSIGSVADPTANPLVYTETDNTASVQQKYGVTLGNVTVTNVVTAGGVTTISGTVATSFGNQALSGTLTGNGTNAIVLNATIAGMNVYLFATNGASQQPGIGNTASIPGEGANVVYDPSAPVCFVAGTRICTPDGYKAVETLGTGDFVLTASGRMQAIKWLGRRVCSGTPLSSELWPVLISAGAFGHSMPSHDLYLSAGHPVLVGANDDFENGYLIPIMCLLNGTTIKRVPVNSVEYWHIELAQHDVLLAEGMPAESYIDLGSSLWFSNADSILCHPDLIYPEMPGRCRPVVIDGPIVENERRRLDAVFANRLAFACSWPDEMQLS